MSAPPPEWDLILSAAQKNRPDLISSYIEKGVNPSHSNAVGQSALHIAALWGNVESVRVLIEAGANCKAQNRLTGATPLHIIAHSNKAPIVRRIEVIDLLLAAGADLTQVDNNGKVPVDFVTPNEGGPNDLEMLMAKLQPTAPTLFQAIWEHNLQHVEDSLACSSGSSVRQLEFRGRNLLDVVVDEVVLVYSKDPVDHDSCIDLIQIFDLIQKIDAGWTVVDSANEDSTMFKLLALLKVMYLRIFETDREIVTRLEDSIALFVAMESSNGDKGTMAVSSVVGTDCLNLVHQAARRNELRFVQFMVERLDLGPNVRNRQGMTPLQFAARSGQMQVLSYLLERPDIELYAQDNRGETALEAARVNDRREALLMLESYLEAKRHS